MQDNVLNYLIKVLGADAGAAEFAKVQKAGQSAMSSVNKLATASNNGAKSAYQLADAHNKTATATQTADKAQENYMFHIAKTTVLSALVNKTFMMLVESMGKAVQQADLISNFPATMGALGLSVNDATDGFAKLKTYIQGVGGDLTKAASTVTRFVGVNKNVQASIAIFAGLNNALIAGGASADVQAQALEQINQAYSRGRPQLIEWKSIMVAMAQPMGLVAEKMGLVNAGALGTALTNGEVSMNKFMTTMAEMGTGTGQIANQVAIKMKGIEFAATVMQNTLTNGLTNIYLAIGRQNIVAFFSFVTQVIQVLTQWVVVLINWVLSLLNLLSKLFGGSGVKQLSKDAGDVNNNLDASASSAGDLGDSLADADKSAKSLNKSLASFDKMNVLADKTSSGSKKSDNGASGAGGLDPTDASSLLDVFNNLGGKLQEISGWAKIFAGILTALALNGLMKKIFGVDMIDTFMRGVGSAMDYLKAIPGRIIAFAQGVGSVLVGIFNDAKTSVKSFGERVAFDTQAAVAAISLTWQTLGPKIAAQFNILKNNIITILDKMGILDFFVNLRDAVVAKITELRDGIVNIFNTIKTAISNAFTGVVEYVVGIFNTMKSVVVTVVGNVVSAIVDKFNMIKTGITNGVTTAINWVVDTFTTLKGKIITAIAPIVEIGKNIANTIMSGINTYVLPIIGPIAEIGKKIGQGIVETARAALGPFATVASGAINGMKQTFSTIGNIISPVVSGAFSKISGAASNLGKKISTSVGNGMHAGMLALGGILVAGLTIVLRDGPAALIDKFNGFITMILNGPQLLATIITAVQTMFQTIAAQTEPIIAAVTQMIGVLVNAIITNAPTMISSFLTSVFQMIQVLLAPETITRIIEATMTLLTNIITTLANILPKLVEAIIGAITTFIGVITRPETINKIIDGVMTLLLNIITTLADILPKIIGAMITAITTIINVITQPDTMTKIIDGTIQLLLKIILALIDVLPKLIDGMITLLTSLIDTITRDDVLTKIIDATIQLIITIALALINNIGKIIEAGVKLIVALAEALTKPETLSKLLDAVWQIVVAIFNAFFSADAIKKWGQIGTDLINGLWNGINNMDSWIGKKVEGFGKGVLDSLKNFFGIKSPSTIMRDQVGQMIGEGIAEGIDDSAKSAVSAAERASSDVLDVFSGMQSSVGDLKSDFSVNGAVSSSLASSFANNSSVTQPTAIMSGDLATETVASLETNTEWIDKISSKLEANNQNSQPLQLTVQIGEERIVTKVIDLINEKTQMSGRNTILV